METKNAVQFLIGFLGDWQDLTFGDLVITDFEQAIEIVKASSFYNVQLRQDDKLNGGTMEWDNF
jgi:hypothetical protein